MPHILNITGGGGKNVKNLKEKEGFIYVFSCNYILSNFILHVFPVLFTDGRQLYILLFEKLKTGYTPTSYPRHVSFKLRPLYSSTSCKCQIGGLHIPKTEPESSGKKNCVVPLRNCKMKFQLSTL